MKYANYYVDYMVYASLLGKSLFVAFGKSFLGFRKIFTSVLITFDILLVKLSLFVIERKTLNDKMLQYISKIPFID